MCDCFSIATSTWTIDVIVSVTPKKGKSKDVSIIDKGEIVTVKSLSEHFRSCSGSKSTVFSTFPKYLKKTTNGSQNSITTHLILCRFPFFHQSSSDPRPRFQQTSEGVLWYLVFGYKHGRWNPGSGEVDQDRIDLYVQNFPQMTNQLERCPPIVHFGQYQPLQTRNTQHNLQLWRCSDPVYNMNLIKVTQVLMLLILLLPTYQL